MRTSWLGVVLLAAVAYGAEAGEAARPGKRRWWVSVAAVAAASVMDMQSSWGRREVNPILRGPDGRFGARGAVVKSSMVGVSWGLQLLLLERKPRMSSAFSGANLGLAAWMAGVAVRNRMK